MSETGLKATSPLDGFSLKEPGVLLVEVSGLAVIAISVPKGGEAALETALQSALGLAWPATGGSSVSDDHRLLGLSRDQAFLLFPHEGAGAENTVATGIAEAGYLFDQSDAWVMLRLQGPHSRAALERICMLDLDDAVFPDGAVSRTLMEHLSVIILREARDRYLLMSPRSSAGSFLDAVETSVRNILPH